MLKKISLQNFRSYSKRTFEFSAEITLIVGPNASGKTNILEAIYLLATGKSFRAELEKEVIREGQKVSRVESELDDSRLEITWDDRERFLKIYKVNGVGKRQVDFIGNLKAVLFSPLDLEIVVNSPGTRRRYLDLVLSQVHKDYRLASVVYEKALRQRNKLLYRIREEGLRTDESRPQLNYWNQLLIDNGEVIHNRRKEYINYLNARPLTIIPIQVRYDHSLITFDRLAHYAAEEIAAAATLVGPHRDDFGIYQEDRHVKLYGSRGEQRLAIFAVKLGELDYIKSQTGLDPLLLLDDIFSELDHANRQHILEVIPKQQTIITTTDPNLIPDSYRDQAATIDLTLD